MVEETGTSNASSLPNLLNYLELNTPVSVYPDEIRIKLTDENLIQYPYVFKWTWKY